MEESPLRRTMYRSGLGTKEIDTLVDYWQDELYRLLSALSPQRAWESEVWRGSKDRAVTAFNMAKNTWKTRVDKAARVFWKRMHEALDMFDKRTGKKSIFHNTVIRSRWPQRDSICVPCRDEADRAKLNASLKG
jgi:hypothetical protein